MIAARRLFFSSLLVLALPCCAAVSQSAPAEPKPSVHVLVESPAGTQTELQIICLFRSSPKNTLHGSLLETNTELRGLLDRVRQPGLFGGELGETLLITPPAGTLGAKRLLLIGLGDSSTFTPERMELVGRIALQEAQRLGVAHPFFAPTVLDGGVTGFNTGAVAEHVVRGLYAALEADTVLHEAGAGPAVTVEDVTFLAGAAHADDTRAGIERASH
jgi:hypothetical protein